MYSDSLHREADRLLKSIGKGDAQLEDGLTALANLMHAHANLMAEQHRQWIRHWDLLWVIACATKADTAALLPPELRAKMEQEVKATGEARWERIRKEREEDEKG